jgi:ABC-2 type transport system permease protein
VRGSVIGQLILKDWRLYRGLILFSIAGGAIALAVIQRGGETAFVVGTVWFFIALILVGHILPIGGIVGERKNQNLAFLMSLPISSIQYATAKLVSTLGMFLIPWLTLVTVAVLLIETRGLAPRGFIPSLLILAFLPFVGFCLITGAALIGETEGWAIAANVFCSSWYGLAWFFLGRIPAVSANAMEPKPVWNSTVLKILSAELGLIVLILALTYYLQSRKRDFVSR